MWLSLLLGGVAGGLWWFHTHEQGDDRGGIAPEVWEYGRKQIAKNTSDGFYTRAFRKMVGLKRLGDQKAKSKAA
jgi:hypothetical protein